MAMKFAILFLMLWSCSGIFAENETTIAEYVPRQQPKFVFQENYFIHENKPPGRLVLHVAAKSMRLNSTPSIISYRLENYFEEFNIHPVSGQVTTLVSFDREEKAFYDITIRAVDRKAFIFSNDDEITSKTYRITILDENDNIPEFEEEEYYIRLPSHKATKFAEILNLTAHDPDENPLIDYAIVDQDYKGNLFFIGEYSGIIRIEKPLKEGINYTMMIQAFDGEKNDITFVTVRVIPAVEVFSLCDLSTIETVIGGILIFIVALLTFTAGFCCKYYFCGMCMKSERA